ncbi:copper homeostasis periplasmic binding protein CopC [Mesorhizobium sp.]|uniref:copper homeostasis periplasmic binding protein CopC n=1 Tax=Mesorhizobium sp. TaxID=1871066 RepID=UPI003BAC5365
MSRTTTSRTAFASSIAIVAVIAVTGGAFAHAELKTAVPAANGSVSASPPEIDLTFSEDLNLKFSGVKVTGPDKKAVKLGESMLMDSNTELMVPVSGTLADGTYKVDWHALSGDGHKTHGSYTFTVKSK